MLIGFCAACLSQEQPAVPKRNLVTFFSKCRAGGPVTVAYLGGSITAADGWRPFTTKWLREQFTGADIKEVNAAIGGTGSLLGVFRLQKHVLQYDPDLVFVEFAVNDNGTPNDSVHATMEGIVRQCWSREEKPDIVFTYTTAHNLDIPLQRHQDVADAYGIPTVDFQKPIQALCPALIDWQILAADTVHPNAWGHAIYAATLATYLKQQMAPTRLQRRLRGRAAGDRGRPRTRGLAGRRAGGHVPRRLDSGEPGRSVGGVPVQRHDGRAVLRDPQGRGCHRLRDRRRPEADA
jgi:lysophospholipase L1-like esterase